MKNNNVVVIKDADKATEACEWCLENIKTNSWDMNMRDLMRPEYTFSFTSEKTAHWFSLKWQ